MLDLANSPTAPQTTAEDGQHAAFVTRGHRFTPRQHQVMGLLLSGLSEKQAALSLGLSVHTVHIYVKQIYRRCGVSSRGELFALMFQKLLGDVPLRLSR